MTYQALLNEASQLGLDVEERRMVKSIKGLYADNVIWINKNIKLDSEKLCILAEELGHHYTNHGDILDQRDVLNRKQEIRARSWAYEYLVPLSKIVQASHEHISGRHNLAEYLGVTEEFLQAAIDRYKVKYGTYTTYKNYTIYFDPLGVMESFE